MQCLTEIKIEDHAYRPTTTYLQRRRPRKRRRRVPLLHNSLNSIGEPTVPEDPEKKQLLYIYTDPERDKHRDTLGLEPARKMGFLCHLVLNKQLYYYLLLVQLQLFIPGPSIGKMGFLCLLVLNTQIHYIFFPCNYNFIN